MLGVDPSQPSRLTTKLTVDPVAEFAEFAEFGGDWTLAKSVVAGPEHGCFVWTTRY